MEELSFNRPQSVGPCGPVWSYQGAFFLGVDSVLHVIIPAISQLECQDGGISKQCYIWKMIGHLLSPKWASSQYG